MDILLLLKALIMGIVEGITEFLPISSTGHLILTGDLLSFLDKGQRDVFVVFIQLGAMLAVIWEYRQKLFGAIAKAPTDSGARRFLSNIVIAFIPAAIFGLLLDDWLEARLFKPIPVAIAFIVGGLIILWAEKRHRKAYGALDLVGSRKARIESVDDMTWKDAIKVGLAQCAALIPGTSRSGATIIGGLFLSLSRKAATEFSFFLGIPTLGAASLYKIYSLRNGLTPELTWLFAIGFISSFIFAFIAIRALIRYVSKHDFVPFAWYRIAFGIIVLVTAYAGVVNWSV